MKKRLVTAMVSLVLSCSVAMTSFACGKKNKDTGDETQTGSQVEDLIPENPPTTGNPDDIFEEEETPGTTPDDVVPPPPPPETETPAEPDQKPDIDIPAEGDDDKDNPPVLPEIPEEPEQPETPAIDYPDAPDVPGTQTPPEATPPLYAHNADYSGTLETEVVLDVGSLIGSVVALPEDFSISYNPSAALRPGAIAVGTQTLPAWLIPAQDWVDADHDYECTDPEHAKHFISFDRVSYGCFDMGVNEADQLLVKLFDGVTAKDYATGKNAQIQLAAIDDKAVGDASAFILTSGRHTASLKAVGAHGRAVYITREFNAVGAPAISVPGGDLSALAYSTEAIDVWQGVSAAGFEGELGYTDDAAKVVDRNMPGAYSVTLSVTDKFGQTSTATRRVVIREYSKAETLAMYETMREQMRKSEWSSSATANYGFMGGTSGSALESANHYENKWYTHIYRENKLNNGSAVQTLGFAAKSTYTEKGMYQSGDTSSWACVNDGAILLSASNGSVSVKRTDPNYSGEFSKGGFFATNRTCNNGILYDFTPTPANFADKCATDLGTKSVSDVQNTYGVNLNNYESVYNITDSTATDCSVTKDANGNLVMTFSLAASAGNPYLKLLNEAMVARWNASGYKGATVSYILDPKTMTPIQTTVSNESFHLEVTTTEAFINRGGRDCDVTEYSYTENFSYTSKASLSDASDPAACKPTITSDGSSSFTENGAEVTIPGVTEWTILDDGSMLFPDGSCSHAGDARFSDVGSVGSNAPKVPGFSALKIPKNASCPYNWLSIGVKTAPGEQYAPAAFRTAGAADWTVITADTDLSVFSAAGTYEIKYYVVVDKDNYTYCNRTIEVVDARYTLGAHTFDDGTPTPSPCDMPAGKVVDADMSAEEFRKFLSKDVSVSDAEQVYLVSLTDSDGNTVPVNSELDYKKYLTAGTTFSARYVAVNGGNYLVFAREFTAVAQRQEVGSGAGSCVKTEGTKAPEFVFAKDVRFKFSAANKNVFNWILSNVSVTADSGKELAARPVGIRLSGESDFVSIDSEAFDFNTCMTTPGEYEIRYYAVDPETKNFSYAIQTVTAYSVPTLSVTTENQSTTTIRDTEYVTFSKNEKGDETAEREKILNGVTLTDADGEDSLDKIVIEGAIDYTPNTFSLIKLIYTNRFGETITAYRTFYVRAAVAPEIHVSLEGQPTIAAGEKSYAAYYPHEGGSAAQEKAKILAGITITDDTASCTIDDIKIDGFIDYTKPGQFSILTLTLTNKDGVTGTFKRYIYVRPYAAPDIDVSLDGQKVTQSKNGVDLPYYYISEKGDAAAEREKILKGVTVSDEFGGAYNLDDIEIDGEIDYTDGATSIVTLSWTNEYGITGSVKRYFYVRSEAAPKITVSLENQPSIETNGKTYAAYYAHQKGKTDAEERAKILAGVTVTDEYGSCSLEDVKIEGAIDYTKKGEWSTVELTVTNKFGISYTYSRIFYVRPYTAPTVKIDNGGMETETIGGHECVVYRFDRLPSDDDLKKGISYEAADGLDKGQFSVTMEKQLSTERGGLGKVTYTVTHPYDPEKTGKVTRYYYSRNYVVDDMNGDAIAIYNEMENVMAKQTYFLKETGTSEAKGPLGIGGTLKLYSSTDHTPDAFYLDNVSSGKKVVGNCTSFGRRLYLKKNGNTWTGKFGSLDGQEKTEKLINGTPGYAVNEWSGDSYTDDSYTEEEFKSNFGRSVTQLFGYPVKSSTCTPSGFQKESNGTYTVTYTFKTSGEAVDGYIKQVKTLSGQTVKEVEYANITAKFDKNFRLLSYHANEKYKVTTASATTTNTLDYTYYYNPTGFKVRTF